MGDAGRGAFPLSAGQKENEIAALEQRVQEALMEMHCEKSNVSSSVHIYYCMFFYNPILKKINA